MRQVINMSKEIPLSNGGIDIAREEKFIKYDLEEIRPEGKIALIALYNANSMTRTRLQKIGFLLGKVLCLDSEFGSESHHYGPFSQDVLDSLDMMAEKAIVKSDFNELTEYGKEIVEYMIRVEPHIWSKASQLAETFKDIRGDQILNIVYDLYPEYTDQSKIKDRTIIRNQYSFILSHKGVDAVVEIDDLKITIKEAKT